MPTEDEEENSDHETSHKRDVNNMVWLIVLCIHPHLFIIIPHPSASSHLHRINLSPYDFFHTSSKPL